MEKIVQELQKIIEILSQNQIPAYISYLSSLGPLILTGISVYIGYKQHRQNQDLQKQIANRDSTILLRQNVLETYNSYFNALRVIEQAIGNVADVFSTPQSMYQWCNELQKAYDMLSCSYNQMKLMLDDEQILQTLKTARCKFIDLYNAVNKYYHSGIPLKIISNTWEIISPEYKIAKEDYVALVKNYQAKEAFCKKCDNKNTQLSLIHI